MEAMNIDPLFLAAVAAFGWGLNLMTYRVAAKRLGWPMGEAQVSYPAVPMAIGLLGMAAAAGYASGAPSGPGLSTLVPAGILFAVFWTGFMRVASQSALILAPLAAGLLALASLARLLG